MRKTARPVVWEGGRAQSPSPDPPTRQLGELSGIGFSWPPPTCGRVPQCCSLQLSDQGGGAGNQPQFLSQAIGLPRHAETTVSQQAQGDLALRSSRAAPG